MTIMDSSSTNMDSSSTSISDQALLWAYQCSDEGCEHIVDHNAIKVQHPSSNLLWAHLRYDAHDANQTMHHYGLDQSVIEALTADETRPRMIPLKDGVLIVLRGINNNPNADPEDMVSLRLWFTDTFVISARKHDRKLLSIEDMRNSFDHCNPPKTTGEFIINLVEKLADRIGEVVDTIDEELTHFETHMTDMSNSEIRPRLALARRQTASIRRYLAPQRDALDALYRNRGTLTDADALMLREQTDRTTRYVEDLDLARERSIVLQEELRNQIAEQQNIRMYVLSLVTAIFLPLSFLTGVFGMNVAGLPGTENGDAFVYLTSCMGLLAILLMVVMWWRRWL